MDGFSTQPAAAIAGAIAAQPSASQDRLRRQREVRLREANATSDVDSEASDAPVEGPDETRSIPAKLPDPPQAHPDPLDDRPHIDISA